MRAMMSRTDELRGGINWPITITIDGTAVCSCD
jgi:hypothetical protein